MGSLWINFACKNSHIFNKITISFSSPSTSVARLKLKFYPLSVASLMQITFFSVCVKAYLRIALNIDEKRKLVHLQLPRGFLAFRTPRDPTAVALFRKFIIQIIVITYTRFLENVISTKAFSIAIPYLSYILHVSRGIMHGVCKGFAQRYFITNCQAFY